ncbi:MAG: biotin--[acetyl-CoA-carboxylase] ligase [Flavobacteriales bacterium]|nr:biotin--[acetyl-CoA-carboxylase] ligase [Flavobacteriales bacterium]
MLFRNKAILRLDAVDSTNNYAANLLKLTALPEGTVITAQYQVQGRGQRGNVWESVSGLNALFSVILYPRFLKAENHFALSQIISLALREVLEEMIQQEVYIKWPNDIICKDKKIAGILLETAWNGGIAQNTIAGIGVNVNQGSFLCPNAASIKMLTGKERDIDDVINFTVNAIEALYQKIYSGFFGDLKENYRKSLYRLDESCQFALPDGTRFVGKMKGVDEDGRLVIVDETNSEGVFGLKEVSFIW